MTKTVSTIAARNHLVAASSPLTESPQRVSCCQKAGFGGAILKSTADYVPANSSYGRRVVWKKNCYYADGSLESEILPMRAGITLYREALAATDDMLLIPSVCAFSLAPAEWLGVCRPFAEMGVPMLQLDLFYLGTIVHDDKFLQDFSTLMGVLARELPCLIMPKLNAHFEPRQTCAILSEQGVVWVSLLDSIRQDAPAMHGLHPGATSCFGKFQLPLTMRYLDLAVQHNLKVCAGGGVDSARDVKQLLQHGATWIQIASYALKRGYGAVPQLLGQPGDPSLTHQTWCDVEDGSACHNCGGCRAPRMPLEQRRA